MNADAPKEAVELDPLFKPHKLNGDGLLNAAFIADSFNEFLIRLGKVCGNGREFALAKTHLEQACFFAKKAMAVKPENQER